MKIMTNFLTGGGIVAIFSSHLLAQTPLDTRDSQSLNTNSPQLGSREVKLQKSVVSAASGSEKNVVDAPASVSIITKEELESKPYRDLGEALKEVPGVSLEGTSNKLGQSAISIRGMPAGYTLFLIDGLRQNPSGDVATANLGVGVYNSFLPPLSAIERIEVIRGPMSTLYGSDALGGVVNIITKPITREWTGSMQSQFISPESSTFGNSYQNSLYISGPLKDNIGLLIRGRQITREASAQPRNDKGEAVNSFFGSQYVAYNLGGRLSFLPNEKHLLYADIDYTQSTYDNQIGQIGTLYVNQQGRGGYTPWVGINKLMGALSHRGDYSFGTWKSSVQYIKTENTGRLVAGNTSSPNLGKNRDITSNDVIVDSRLLVYLGEHNNLNLGLEYRYENYHDLAATPANHNRNTFALFAEDEWNIIDNLTFTLGTRYNYNDKFGSNLSPRAYLVYEIIDGFALKGGVATGYKAPYANQLIDAVYGYGSQGTLAFLGNPDLKAESSISYEFGAILEKEHITSSLMLFHSQFKDKIESMSVTKTSTQANYSATCATYGGSNNSCRLAYNADSAFSQGIEATFGLRDIWGFSFDTSYTFINSEITSGTNKGNPLSTTAKHQVIGKLGYNYKDFGTYLQAQYKQGIVNTSAIGNTAQAQALYNLFGGIYYKPSLLLNLGLSYKLTQNIRLHGGVYNLLDTNFADFRSYSYNNSSGNVNWYGPVIQEGRRYWAQISLDF
ncbi:TonB-dependent receptor domain-containing protein [Helicobacter marmotae]|uniref:TonB-dependent receptor n=1 Tax=Helicobacter marmotae TaxID=152490 RepID=A0A3D8I784_9HELI|nr:TonB-dependent receptor [Helicobacter marmotae]RDU60977.1 TonB-dependent receptor [Helicobacter marmotae]